MTTLETLTARQVINLQIEAETAADETTARDCERVYQAYAESECADLQGMLELEGGRGEATEAARRIVEVIRNAEARRESD